MMFFWRQRFKLPPWRVCWKALLQHDAAKKMRFQDVDILLRANSEKSGRQKFRQKMQNEQTIHPERVDVLYCGLID